jgi:hypothetical protein
MSDDFRSSPHDDHVEATDVARDVDVDEAPPSRRFGGYDIRLYRSVDEAIAGGEKDARLVPPRTLSCRFDWFEAMADGTLWWLAIHDLQQRPVAGYSVTRIPTRSLPGHRTLRLERLRFAPSPGPAEAAVRYLVDFARRDWRTLGLTVETFFADPIERNAAVAALVRAGLRPADRVRTYRHTLRIDLEPEPEKLLSNFHATARRNIRAVMKRPVDLRLVHDPALAPRLDKILRETFARTAGPRVRERWRELIDYSRAHPDRARLVSLVRTDRTGPDALVAFALGLNHGDHVEYARSGSTRPSDLRMPLAYALAWDLMSWARTVGTTWFDFGGIVPGPTQDDARRGIHAFKRKFGENVVEVSQTWSLDVRPVRIAWVREVSRLARQLRLIGRRVDSESPSTPESAPPRPLHAP